MDLREFVHGALKDVVLGIQNAQREQGIGGYTAPKGIGGHEFPKDSGVTFFARIVRKIIVTPPLFPGYLFLWVVSGWWNARWSPGVVRLIMDGLVPAVVRDDVIAEIRSRERNGLIELPKPRGLRPGIRVRVISGPLSEQIGMLAALRPHERVLVLLQLLGGQQRVELARSSIEAVE